MRMYQAKTLRLRKSAGMHCESERHGCKSEHGKSTYKWRFGSVNGVNPVNKMCTWTWGSNQGTRARVMMTLASKANFLKLVVNN